MRPASPEFLASLRYSHVIASACELIFPGDSDADAVSVPVQAGSVTIDGLTWQRLDGGNPEPRALLRTSGGASTLVAGSASWAELRRLAASLQP